LTERLIKSIITEELFGTRICESLDQTQLVEFIYEDTIFPEAIFEKLLIGEPVTVPELRQILHNKIVNFEFVKLDGNVRPAKGTTVMKHVPSGDQPKGIRPSSDKVAAFWDMDKDAWRSVSNRSKEIVLQKDKTGKPVVRISDKQPKEEPIEPETTFDAGKTYNFTTKDGVDAEVKVLKELPNGLIHVKSPKYKNTFAIDPSRIGSEIIDPEMEPEARPVPPRVQQIVRPSVRPRAPLPIPTKQEEIPTAPAEEVPLNLSDPLITADDVKDKDIIAPGIEKPAKPDDELFVEPEAEKPKEKSLPPIEEITFKDKEEEKKEDDLDNEQGELPIDSI